jgi:hypothetical protein
MRALRLSESAGALCEAKKAASPVSARAQNPPGFHHMAAIETSLRLRMIRSDCRARNGSLHSGSAVSSPPPRPRCLPKLRSSAPGRSSGSVQNRTNSLSTVSCRLSGC